MDYIGYSCVKENFKSFNYYDVKTFDVFRNFDLLHKYYVKLGVRDYDTADALEKSFITDVADDDTWCEYVILKGDQIADRSVAWKVSDKSWEVAAVSTDPQYRQQGYAICYGNCFFLHTENIERSQNSHMHYEDREYAYEKNS